MWRDREKGGNTPHIRPRESRPTGERDRKERRVRRLVLVSLFESYVLVRGAVYPLSAGRRVLLVSYSCVWTRSQTRVCCVQVVFYIVYSVVF